MNLFAKTTALTAVLASMGTCLCAEVKLPEIFGNHMVLQQEAQVPVWGNAAPDEKVTVKFNGQEKSAVAGKDGKWKLELDPMKAGGPFKMEVSASNNISVDDVLVGEVWLCSGQSNMEWSLKGTNNATEEIANANYPQIRLFHVKKAWKTTPQDKLEATWKVCSPETIPSFSAVAYFFGRELNKTLKVPVGLINSSWGGTRIEPWTPPVGFKTIPALRSISEQIIARTPGSDINKKLLTQAIGNYKKWLAQAETALTDGTAITPPAEYPKDLVPFASHQSPTVLYNAMLNPLVPYAMRGAIWYQGESNRGEGMLYAEKMRALIEGWRNVWGNDKLAFYFVQLAPYNYKNNPEALPMIWVAQESVTKTIPYTGMAVISDVGNLKDIHPRDKQTVGYRLALQALNKTYGKKDMVSDSPLFKDMKIDGNTAIITFDNAESLKTRDGKAPTWFELCGGDGVFHKAEAVISGSTVSLSAKEVETPFVARFAWDMLAEPNLTNQAGLPASAFKAGEIPARGTLDALVPEAKDFKLIYKLDPTSPKMTDNGTKMVYAVNNSADIVGEIEKIAYALILNGKDYVFVSMDPFTADLKKIGVPDKASGARFQTMIKNMTVKSNVTGVKNGSFPEGGNIEFWDCNYGQGNAANIPGASASAFDFGDMMGTNVSPGYGSMQVHNYSEKQTLFAFNNFRAGGKADLGIGNKSSGSPDWTFSGNAGSHKSAELFVLVKLK